MFRKRTKIVALSVDGPIFYFFRHRDRGFENRSSKGVEYDSRFHKITI
jgi:hypothetical protein